MQNARNIEVLKKARAVFSEIGFYFCAKNKANINIEKRIGLAKNMVRKAKYFLANNLSFLCVNRKAYVKDKYA